MALLLPDTLPTLQTATGRFALAPFTPLDVEPLAQLLARDEIWSQGFSDSEARPAGPDELTTFVERRFSGLPVFSVYLTGAYGQSMFVGTTGITDHEPETERVKIGRTVLTPDLWGAKANHEVKVALLDWLFSCGAGRIECDVDSRNQRSLSSLARFGFTIEGTRRRSSRNVDGLWRDFVILSLLTEEWAELRGRALASLAAFMPAAGTDPLLTAAGR